MTVQSFTREAFAACAQVSPAVKAWADFYGVETWEVSLIDPKKGRCCLNEEGIVRILHRALAAHAARIISETLKQHPASGEGCIGYTCSILASADTGLPWTVEDEGWATFADSMVGQNKLGGGESEAFLRMHAITRAKNRARASLTQVLGHSIPGASAEEMPAATEESTVSKETVQNKLPEMSSNPKTEESSGAEQSGRDLAKKTVLRIAAGFSMDPFFKRIATEIPYFATKTGDPNKNHIVNTIQLLKYDHVGEDNANELVAILKAHAEQALLEKKET